MNRVLCGWYDIYEHWHLQQFHHYNVCEHDFRYGYDVNARGYDNFGNHHLKNREKKIKIHIIKLKTLHTYFDDVSFDRNKGSDSEFCKAP